MKSNRYLRQTILKDFGPEAQQKLRDARVLVVGAGGLGVPALQYLNSMGVGTIGLIDQDVVSYSNLHRQVLYAEKEVGRPKVEVAAEKLQQQNTETHLIAYPEFLVPENALSIIQQYDLVLDASDNFPTRYLVNDACVLSGKPFVYGALHRFEGYVSVFNHLDGPTYRCLYPEAPKAEEIPNCNEIGVLGILPGIIGSLQTLEAVKVITGIGTPLSGKLLIFNSLDQSMHQFSIPVNPENKKIQALQDSYALACDHSSISISGSELETLLEAGEQQIVDVRTASEYHDFHLNPSLNIPLDQMEMEKDKLNYDEPIYVICQSGIRSAKAIHLLKQYRPSARFINIKDGLNGISRIERSI